MIPNNNELNYYNFLVCKIATTQFIRIVMLGARCNYAVVFFFRTYMVANIHM